MGAGRALNMDVKAESLGKDFGPQEIAAFSLRRHDLDRATQRETARRSPALFQSRFSAQAQ